MDRSEYSPYAPIRMRTHPYWQVARGLARDGNVTADGRIDVGLYDFVDAVLIHPMIQSLAGAASSGEINGVDGAVGGIAAKVLVQKNWVPLIGQFEACGRQIFDLHDHLADMLLHTDVKDVTLENLHVPYAAFYVRLGIQETVRLPFGQDQFEYVDGAFVALAPWDEHGNLRMKVGFSTVHADGRGVGYPGPFFDLLPDELRLPVPDAIDAALRRRLLEQSEAPGDDPFTTALKSHLRAEIEDSAELMHHCAALLFNALFYLESIEHHLPEPSPGRDTPPKQVALWLGQPSRRHKLKSSLTADGYAVVRLVGGELDSPSSGAGQTGLSRRVHWRRGHWRMQPHGPQKSLRRRQWIKPILVGGATDAGPDASYGHIYVLPDASNSLQ